MRCQAFLGLAVFVEEIPRSGLEESVVGLEGSLSFGLPAGYLNMASTEMEKDLL